MENGIWIINGRTYMVDPGNDHISRHLGVRGCSVTQTPLRSRAGSISFGATILTWEWLTWGLHSTAGLSLLINPVVTHLVAGLQTRGPPVHAQENEEYYH